MTWQKLFENPAARVKSWVKTLLEHRELLERAAGRGQLGQVLGCGHWGCVVDLVGTPYVLKLTVDPTEAHVWAKIVELIGDERYGDDGFPRIKKIFKLEPGIPYGSQGRTKTSYGIVREKVVPVFDSKGDATLFTQQFLGANFTWYNLVALEASFPDNHKVQDFTTALKMLRRYKEAAERWHAKPGRGPMYSVFSTRTDALQGAEAAASRMSGAIGSPLGESLSMLASNEVLLRDVHFGNIGWRYLTDVEGEEGYTCLVVFDPGHTPTGRRELPAESWIQLAQLC